MIGGFFRSIQENFAPKHVVRLIKSPAWILLTTGLLSNVISIFIAIYTLLVYDKVYPHDGFNTLVVLTAGVVALLIIDVSLKFLRTKTINIALYGSRNETVDLEVRREQFQLKSNRLQSDSTSYLRRSIEGLSDLRPSDVRTATLIVDLPFTLLLLAAIFFIASYLVLVPIAAAFFLLVFVSWNHRKNKEAAKELEKAKQSAIENYSFLSRGADWLFGIGGWKWLASREKAAVDLVANKSASVAALSSSRQTIYQAVMQVVSISMVFFGFFLFREGQIGLGGIIASYLLANKALSPIGTIVQMGAMSESSTDSDTPARKTSEKLDLHPSYDNWNLSVRDLSFTYDGQTRPAIKLDKIDICSRERIALIGRSGSGKSTFAKVIVQSVTGFDGDVSWNKIPVESIGPDAWSKHCVYVPQTPWMGKGSLFDQIRLGDESISDQEIGDAIASVDLQDVLAYKSEQVAGDGLSAGQLQALSLVRCLVRKAPLLILDEPTNFLDEETEKKLIDAIFDRYAESTIIVITHRRSLLSMLDRAVVFENGRLTRDGKIVKEAS